MYSNICSNSSNIRVLVIARGAAAALHCARKTCTNRTVKCAWRGASRPNPQLRPEFGLRIRIWKQYVSRHFGVGAAVHSTRRNGVAEAGLAFGKEAA